MKKQADRQARPKRKQIQSKRLSQPRKRKRQITYLQVAETLRPDGEVGPESIKSALYRRGYRRRSALRKPPLSDANIQARLLWAIEHKDWTSEQWNLILWSDETWVKAGKHRKQFVTRKKTRHYSRTVSLIVFSVRVNGFSGNALMMTRKALISSESKTEAQSPPRYTVYILYLLFTTG